MLNKVISGDTTLCVMREGQYPYVYLQSDGGHDGLNRIAFCPFCGTKIEFNSTEAAKRIKPLGSK